MQHKLVIIYIYMYICMSLIVNILTKPGFLCRTPLLNIFYNTWTTIVQTINAGQYAMHMYYELCF